MSTGKMMNIFVASRMKNIVERKAVIDVVHSTGHSPVFIEAEQMRQAEKSKQLMDDMIQRSDALIAVTDDHLGLGEGWLGDMTPLVYEIETFKEKCQQEGWGLTERLILFYRQNFLGRPVSSEVHSFVSALVHGGKHVKPYRQYDDLAVAVRKEILGRWGEGKREPRPPIHFHIQYSGRDKPGTLGTIAEILYTKYHLNVTHVAGSKIDKEAFLLVTATPWSADEGEPNADEISSGLEKIFEEEGITVKPGPGSGFESKFYFELRVLDVPGILSALCKALNDLCVNIDELRQRPAPWEFDRQSTMLMWLSPADGSRDLADCYLQVESRLRNLVGVVSISSHIMASAAAPPAAR